jgi:hypothetical protein
MTKFFKKKNLKEWTVEPPKPAGSPVFPGFSGFLPVLSRTVFAHQPDVGPVPSSTGPTGRSGPILTTCLNLIKNQLVTLRVTKIIFQLILGSLSSCDQK